MSMQKSLYIKRIEKLKELYDLNLIPKLEIHEVHPSLPQGSRENYLYFTLPVSLNFQRSSPAMWNSALKTFEDPETNYLFFPEKLMLTDLEKAKEDLFKHRLSVQKNKHFDIWYKISKTLFEKYNSDPRDIFRMTQRCVTRTKNLMSENKKDFPYLSGIKMSNYWLFILSNFTDIKLRNLHKVSIIPDTHVLKASVELGLIEDANMDRKIVEEIWFEVLNGSGILPIEMHPILWNWSRNNFKPTV